MVDDSPPAPLLLTPVMRHVEKWRLNGRIAEMGETLDVDVGMLTRFGIERAMQAGLAPVRRMGAVTLIATERAALSPTRLAEAEARFGPLAVRTLPKADIKGAIETRCAAVLADRALRRTAPEHSCRDWSGGRVGLRTATALAILALWAMLHPASLVIAAALWATLTLAALSGLRTLAALVEFRAARRLSQGWRSVREQRTDRARLPVMSLLVPLYQERDMAGHLLARLSALDYPRDRLEVLLILEAGDRTTEEALRAAVLPPEARVVRVPAGDLRTKPRALNYAFDFARGDIVGIYDAEDAPAPDQLLRVADSFARAAPDVACLQGVLDFYNPRQSWLTRAFTIDYATWFRLVLPGLVKLGLPIPLGGTTVFLRREVVERIGRWDAHNVTEDADLGLRLARMGYRTEFVASVTEEEATAQIGAWIRQRSRWIKGYAVTWAVHMRQPLRLWRELGPRGFLTVQILFLGTLSQFVLAPLLWSFWVVPFGIWHPVMAVLPVWGVYALAAIFFASEIATVAVAALSVATPRHRGLIWWVPLMHLYWPLAALASWKSFAELFWRPFFWDKTAHGTSLGARAAA